VPPVVPQPTKEGAVYTLNLLSATGTGILLSAIVGGLVMKYNPVQLASQFLRTIWLVRYSLLTIVLMLALGTLTRYSGTDTTLGLAFANTGVFYPFFGTLMVASTATRWFNHEGDILRYVFFHSIALACLMGIFVTLQAYVWPFRLMVN
jgi:lactate permease